MVSNVGQKINSLNKHFDTPVELMEDESFEFGESYSQAYSSLGNPSSLWPELLIESLTV